MSAVLSMPAAPPQHWRLPLAVLGGVLLLLLWQYRETFLAMVGIWERSGTFAHAFLVPPISLWLVWRQRERLARLNPKPLPWMLLPALLCGLAWLVGDLAGVNALTQLAVTALLVLAVPALLGWQVARVLAFPLGFLFFMVPIGEFVMPLMMEWTADVTVATVRAIGIPVYREGLQFVIPTGSWSVVEACSGVRYLIASFMVGTLFAYLNYNSTRRRLAFVGFSLLMPIVANWGRAVMIVLLGHYSGNKLAVGVDHLIYGWVFFGIVIGIMFLVGSGWAEPELALPPVSAAEQAAWQLRRAPLQWWVAASLVLVLSAPPLLANRLQMADTPTPLLRLPALPGTADVPGAEPLHKPTYENPRAEASRVYGQGAAAITVHVAYYRQQTFGRKLVNSQNVLVTSDDKLWRQTSRSSTAVTVAGEPLVLRTAELRSGSVGGLSAEQTLQVRQLYWVNGRLTTSNHLAALLGVAGQLTGRGDDAAGLTFYISGSGPEAQAQLDLFIAQQLGPLSTWLNSVRMQR
ncbi:exosortase A [Rubrivivax rivuli]|uniref:Exosortase A n=1 Tax=Rubrivivax rivuli TaxID=1862385 RepID=A0A437RST2_9BURK|nr:exosortase A [Rubrivivax rivuli]RVU49818.1 exosortase A [Rubrivivax rivuli]